MKIIRLITPAVFMLFSIIAYTQPKKNVYYPKLPQVELSIAKINLAQILKKASVWQSGPNHIPTQQMDEIVNVSVSNNRIQIDYKSYNQTIYFSDIFQSEIGTLWCKGKPNYPCIVKIGDYYFSLSSLQEGGILTKELADYLFYFQHHSNQEIQQQYYDSLISLFKPIANEYSNLKVKPAVSEEQRKYIVQANLLNQEKMYDKAIELYNKANEIDPTSYPSAYTNLALLSAQVKDFQTAIYYMKKYLLLVPESEDARSCQDKIYEWEVQITK